jgi:hypothetical protein
MTSVKLFQIEDLVGDTFEKALHLSTARAAIRDPLVLFMFPGQPVYREHLGRHVPPPRVRFSDCTWHAEREFAATALAKLAVLGGAKPDDDLTLAPAYEDLDQRLRRFRDAEYAARRGLPLNTFD